jgi:hypothetical protein
LVVHAEGVNGSWPLALSSWLEQFRDAVLSTAETAAGRLNGSPKILPETKKTLKAWKLKLKAKGQ